VQDRVGTDLIRLIKFDGDRITLRTPWLSVGGTIRTTAPKHLRRDLDMGMRQHFYFDRVTVISESITAVNALRSRPDTFVNRLLYGGSVPF
jgi:hypothetical protein